MPVVEIHKCPICGSANIQKFLDCCDDCVTGETFEIANCADCGFIFTQNFPDDTTIGRYYNTPAYISHSDTKKGIINTVYHLVRETMLRKKAELTEKYAPCKNGSLLDIGCGTGYYAATMQQRGWKTVGIEKNESAAKFANEQHGVDVLAPDELVRFEDGRFDAITLWHVLEHLQDLQLTVDTLKRILKPDGTLIVALPNQQSYDARHYMSHWAAWDVPRHLWHFSPETFGLLMRKNGFKVIRKKKMPFDGFYISMLSEKYKKSTLPLISGFYHGFVGWAGSWFDYKKSSSVIYILKHA